eukprot:s1018_g18.t1
MVERQHRAWAVRKRNRITCNFHRLQHHTRFRIQPKVLDNLLIQHPVVVVGMPGSGAKSLASRWTTDTMEQPSNPGWQSLERPFEKMQLQILALGSARGLWDEHISATDVLAFVVDGSGEFDEVAFTHAFSAALAHLPEGAPVVLLVNKVDADPEEEASKMADSHGSVAFLVSAKTSYGCDEVPPRFLLELLAGLVVPRDALFYSDACVLDIQGQAQIGDLADRDACHAAFLKVLRSIASFRHQIQAAADARLPDPVARISAACILATVAWASTHSWRVSGASGTSSDDLSRSLQHAAVEPMAVQSDLMTSMFGDLYTGTSVPLLAATGFLAWQTRPTAPDVKQSDTIRGFRTFQFQYLLVWFLAITADWLQGPYVYELYASYGWSKAEIAQLFVAGFASSMITGTFIGSVADAWGRKFCAILYCILYALACLTKHVNVYGALMIGRLLGGAATSLLFSTFECWMVGEHKRCGFPDHLLRYMFGLMFFVQYLAAIGAGWLAQFAASSMPLTQFTDSIWYGGSTAPFDLSLVFLLTAAPTIHFLWKENYGEQTDSSEGVDGLSQIGVSFQAGCHALASDWRVPLLGLAVAAFESSMYVFVFNWTPALDSCSSTTPPHGLIFSAFMMACMCGSSVFNLLDESISPIKVLWPVCLAAASSLGAVAASLYTTYSEATIFFGFLAFEACVGAYFPCVSTVKSQIVPEEARAGVYNVYRVPLNLCVVLLLLGDLELKTSFAICSTLLLTSVIAIAFIGAQPRRIGKGHTCRCRLFGRRNVGCPYPTEFAGHMLSLVAAFFAEGLVTFASSPTVKGSLRVARRAQGQPDLPDAGIAVIEKVDRKTQMKEQFEKEKWWRVLLHNDDIHTFEYEVAKAQEEDEDEDEEEDDDAPDEPPPPPEQAERLRRILSRSFMFSSLAKTDFDTVLLAMKEDFLCLIEEGNPECKKLIDGEEKVVKKCVPGDIFGELALLYNAKRAASVYATDTCVAWQLDRETFNHIVTKEWVVIFAVDTDEAKK